MAVLHVSEAEAVRDIALLLVKARTGTEIIIQGEEGSIIAVLNHPGRNLEEPEPGYDDWFRAEIARTLQNDPGKRISEDDAETMMEGHRDALLRKLHGSAA